MARIQLHHITYNPEWTVELNMLQHRTISRIQISHATPQRYADLTNFLHAVTYEWNRMRKELDLGGDLRVLNRQKKKPKEKPMFIRRALPVLLIFIVSLLIGCSDPYEQKPINLEEIKSHPEVRQLMIETIIGSAIIGYSLKEAGYSVEDIPPMMEAIASQKISVEDIAAKIQEKEKQKKEQEQNKGKKK